MILEDRDPAVLFDVGEPILVSPPEIPPEPPKPFVPDPTEPMVFSPPLAGAIFSECGVFRYVLWRIFSLDPRKKKVTWILHNPSFAGAELDDNSVKRMISFSLREGAGHIAVVNKDAFVATHPGDMRRAARGGTDVRGPENMKHVAEQCKDADLVIVAWGAGGEAGDSGRKFFAELQQTCAGPFYCLGRTQLGHPRHPLRLSGKTPLVPFEYKDQLVASVEELEDF